jgi:hypothetical protein
VENLAVNIEELQILTDSGWEKFDGIVYKGKQKIVKIQLENSFIFCTLDHELYVSKNKKKRASAFKPGDKVVSYKHKYQKVIKASLHEISDVYDVLNAGKNKRFYANELLVSNCEFIIEEETLINSITLLELGGIDPLTKQGQIRWYKKPEANKTYIVALDPSLGTGGDPAAIQVLELPSMYQVAEWTHNKTPIQQQIKILSEITKTLVEVTQTSNTVYYSVENNAIGEAALLAISEIGEENIKGVFLSEPKRAGTTRAYRKGFTTTNKSKIAVCSKLKSLIENKKMTVASKNLISELKTFVASGVTFQAKSGETDDLVMALLLAVRMATFLREFDMNLDEQLKDKSDDLVLPMPFIIA